MTPEKQIPVAMISDKVDAVVALDDLISTGDSYQMVRHNYGKLGSNEYGLAIQTKPQILEKI